MFINIFQNCRSWIPKTSTVSYKKMSQTTWVHFLLQYSTYFQLLFIQCNHFLNILSLSSWVLLKACCLMGTKPLPGQIHTTCNKWFAISKLTHCGLVTLYGRAGVKYVLSNTNTNTNTFFSGVSNTNTNTNTLAKIWSNTNTNTAHQIQIQIHNEAETKLPPFLQMTYWILYCKKIVYTVHSNFTENCFLRSNLQ